MSSGCKPGRDDQAVRRLCAVKDVFSNRIVGYSIDSRMKSSLAVAALANAVAQRTPDATIVHSDRGSQFRGGRIGPILQGRVQLASFAFIW